MTKYEIFTDRFEFRAGARLQNWTSGEVFDEYQAGTANCPKLECSFDRLEDAVAEFEKNYKDSGRTWAEATNVHWLLIGEVAFLEENEYDDDGDFVQGGDIIDFSAEPYESR